MEESTQKNQASDQVSKPDTQKKTAPVKRTFRNGPSRQSRSPREEKEFEEKILDLRRVVRVTGGGKRFRFRVAMIIGDRKGRIGMGIAKGKDVPGAISKAKALAERNIIKFPLTGNTIDHEVHAKFCASKVVLKPASVGHGLVAGGSVRIVCSLVGIKDISAKILGTTTNKINNAHATLLALKKIRTKKAANKK